MVLSPARKGSKFKSRIDLSKMKHSGAKLRQHRVQQLLSSKETTNKQTKLVNMAHEYVSCPQPTIIPIKEITNNSVIGGPEKF